MQNKLIPGILLGAVIGGAATLADKSTRQSFV
jgi:gas vesicle protein